MMELGVFERLPEGEGLPKRVHLFHKSYNRVTALLRVDALDDDRPHGEWRPVLVCG